MNKYDVLVIGMGPAGIATARECKKRRPGSKILILEKGRPIDERFCPSQVKGSKCLNCHICNVMSGSGGAGAHSDGKFTMPQREGLYHIGGNLPKYIGLEYTNQLVMEQHLLNISMGSPNNIISNRNEAFITKLDKKLKENGFFRADADINHIGTSAVTQLYKSYENELIQLGCEIMFSTTVEDIVLKNGRIIGVITREGEKIFAENVVFATGRSGSRWLESMASSHGIEERSEEVDLGFRMEVPTETMKELNNNLYEAKIIAKYGDVMVRMFCTNPDGEVVCETTEGIKYVNGHADNLAKSHNTNFAILAQMKVNSNNPSELVRNIALGINQEGQGQPVVQRWGDLCAGKATTERVLSTNKVVPTLRAAVPGDMTKVFPYKPLRAIKKYMSKLGKIIPGINADDVLAYGLEAKFCHGGLVLDHQLRCSIGAFVPGDAGPTHGLASAAASGTYVARCIYPGK